MKLYNPSSKLCAFDVFITDMALFVNTSDAVRFRGFSFVNLNKIIIVGVKQVAPYMEMINIKVINLLQLLHEFFF